MLPSSLLSSPLVFSPLLSSSLLLSLLSYSPLLFSPLLSLLLFSLLSYSSPLSYSLLSSYFVCPVPSSLLLSSLLYLDKCISIVFFVFFLLLQTWASSGTCHRSRILSVWIWGLTYQWSKGVLYDYVPALCVLNSTWLVIDFWKECSG